MSKWDIPDNINFAYYESPIKRIFNEMETQLAEKMESNKKQLIMRVQDVVGYDIEEKELLKALQYDRDQYAKGYAAGLNADRWISVEDRLPEETGSYLAYIINADDNKLRYAMTADFYSKRKEWVPDDECASNNVVAWQELPKPYEKAGESDG